MKRISTKTAKIVATIILAAIVAFSVMGCSVEKTVTKTETHTDDDGNKVTVTSTQTLDKNGNVKNGTAVIGIEPEDVKILTYVSEDGNWKISYDTSKYFLNDTLGNGEICFNYIGECSGTHAVIISYHKDQMPDEVLYEMVKDIDNSRIERGECSFGQDMYWSHFRHIKPENEDPEMGDVVYEGYTAIEHNGGTVLFDFIGHLETNDEWYSNEINEQSRLLNTFELLNHQPQTEYAYIPGTYIHEYTDEIGGEEVNIKESVILKEDHSCEMTFQDTAYGEWTGTKIEMNWGDEYEYSVEGDSLYLNMNGEWIEFNKKG